MNVDRFNAVNTLATRVAGAVVPGLAISSLAERPDPDSALSRRFLAMLQALRVRQTALRFSSARTWVRKGHRAAAK